MEVAFENLKEADLVVDTIYKGGTASGKASEVLSKLMPGCSNSGGFRKVMRKDGSGLPAFVVLYTSMRELAWPDYLDEETGIFRYYGDNRNPGRTILDTPRKGNLLLEFVFECLNSKDGSIKNIPPFFIFKKTGNGWDVQFLGLAAPGNPRISPDKDLVAFWRTIDENRFQNYEAYFTVLETIAPISREWLNALIYNHDQSLDYTVKKRMISFESDKDQRKQFKEMTKELDDYILELYDKIDKDHNANAKMKNMDFSRYPFNTDDEYHFYIENYGNEVVDLEMFVEVFKKIGDNLNCIAGYYEEMATFVSDYD